MGLKDLLLNKGWAGTTMSRRETAERLNPILRRYYELMYAYDNLLERTSDRGLAEQITRFQKVTRADIGKLSESVLSAGGVPYNGTDMKPGTIDLGDASHDAVPRLRDLEEGVHRMLTDELEENHQIRTRAILSVLHTNSAARLEFLRGEAKKILRGA